MDGTFCNLYFKATQPFSKPVPVVDLHMRDTHSLLKVNMPPRICLVIGAGTTSPVIINVIIHSKGSVQLVVRGRLRRWFLQSKIFWKRTLKIQFIIPRKHLFTLFADNICILQLSKKVYGVNLTKQQKRMTKFVFSFVESHFGRQNNESRYLFPSQRWRYKA